MIHGDRLKTRWKQHDLQRLSNALKTCICQSNVFAKFHCHLASCKKVRQLIGSCCICQLDPSELRCHTDIQKRLSLRQLHFALSFLRWFRMTWLHSPAHQTTTQCKSFVKVVPWSQFKNDQTKLYTRKKGKTFRHNTLPNGCLLYTQYLETPHLRRFYLQRERPPRPSFQPLPFLGTCYL